MLRSIAIIGLCVSGAVLAQVKTLPPADVAATVIAKGKTYYIINKSLGWQEAADYADLYDMVLATIPSGAVNIAITTEMQKRAIGAVWIGLSDRITEGQWSWTAGDEYKFQRWQPNEPNNSTKFSSEGEDFVILQSNGYWNDYWSTAGGPTFAFVLQGP